ncbi:MAG: spore coat associated protein CotJA [Oscillospiraceae bacterium]|nr:spore coat associated protein CotJA [Oscillospiraceae bacterium]
MRININGDDGVCMDSMNTCNCEMGDSVMVFIQPQKISSVYSFTDAFKKGTLYPELDKPFMAGGCDYAR